MIKRNVRQSYDRYKNEVDNPVPVSDYLHITGEYNKFLVEKVLEGHEVMLPARMGTLAILGKKQNIKVDEDGKIRGLAPDWVSTKKLWDENPEAKKRKQLVYHTNEHTDNTRYKFFWHKASVLVGNKTLYSLKMTRGNKRAVHQRIKDGHQYKTTN